jgi:TIR domain
LDKEVDLRKFSSCWLSRVVTTPNANFRRILCFEPRYRGRATEVVGDIFRSIIPFTAGHPPTNQIAMPLVASGDQGESTGEMLEALVEASVHWLLAGLPLDRIKIVVHQSNNYQKLTDIFSRMKNRFVSPEMDPSKPSFDYDVFVSYSQKNKESVDSLVENLRYDRPSLRVFLDRLELRPGAAWQQQIFEALDASRKVICMFTPDYLASKICVEEFNMALHRHRDSSDGVLLPIYLHTASLPTYMILIQFQDVREGNLVKISQSAKILLEQI